MKKVLLIATGGTIASRKTPSGLSPSISCEELLSFVPDAKSICSVDAVQPFSVDSTNISPDHWLLLASIIRENYHKYDGFVICHGTDTIAYSAAALSYLIQNTSKPIVLTGAQRPIDEDSTDAKTNLCDSLRFASSYESGVVIVFGGNIIAGTRAKKVRTKSYNAFQSINFPEIGVIHPGRVVRYIPFQKAGEPEFYDKLSRRVQILKLTPGMPVEALLSVGELSDGLIIESYGVGGIPDIYLDAIDSLVRLGKIIVMATQVDREGSDLAVYQVGHRLKKEYRLLETYDMTPEATLTKLMWALGRSNDKEEVRRLFCRSINYDMLF